MAGNGRKITNFLVVHGGRRRRFAGPILEHPTAVRREISPEGSSGCCAPSRLARVTGGRPVVPRLVRSIMLAVNKKTQVGSRFGELFPRVFGAQKMSWGLGFYLASQTMFI